MKTTSKLSLVLAVLTTAAVLPTNAHAQATINATATVQVALGIAGTRPLDFGAAFPGTTRTIQTSDATNSGLFTLTGANNAEVNFQLSTPAALTFGTNNLVPTFNAAWSLVNTGASQTVFATSVTTQQTQRIDAASGKLYVFVGGSVSPTNQPNGAYTGTLTLNAAYTGN
jgi:hypothetical protein